MTDAKLNHKVYQFAHSHVGQFVGARHECWDFVDRALQYAGAASSTTTGSDDDYVWGTAITVHQVIAGDILQFRDFVITTTTTTTTTFDNGDQDIDVSEVEDERPHHTAIVVAYKAPGRATVLEQNQPTGERVRQRTIALQSAVPVVKTSLRYVKDSDGKARHATIEVRTEVEVTGQVWAYRPTAKE